jgi:mersacidin/lichenicidin family type 2 lantibiotic
MIDRRKFVLQCLGLLGLGFIGSKARAKTELSPEDIVKAWEDPSFRSRLSQSQWDALPPNPAGEIKSGEFNGNLELAASGNACSGNNCSGDNCSGNNCSGNNCSGDNCSGNNCSGDNCSGNNCSGNNC